MKEYSILIRFKTAAIIAAVKENEGLRKLLYYHPYKFTESPLFPELEDLKQSSCVACKFCQRACMWLIIKTYIETMDNLIDFIINNDGQEIFIPPGEDI